MYDPDNYFYGYEGCVIIVICNIIEINFRNYKFVIVYLWDTVLSVGQKIIKLVSNLAIFERDQPKLNRSRLQLINLLKNPRTKSLCENSPPQNSPGFKIVPVQKIVPNSK